MSQTDHTQLEQQLQTMHLTAIRQTYVAAAQQAGADDWSYQRYLAHLVDLESQRRERNRRSRYIKEARFPLLKELADFDFSAIPQLHKAEVMSLAEGHYLAQAQPIIMVGNPGLGKTHLSIGLGLTACRQGQRVRFYTVTNLVNQLQQAQAEHRLPQLLDKAIRYRLLILDEFGYVPFSTSGAQLLFQFCSALQEKVSLIITTNLAFSDWVQVLGDERLTSGLLDRLTFRANILHFVGESYRFRQQMQQQQTN